MSEIRITPRRLYFGVCASGTFGVCLAVILLSASVTSQPEWATPTLITDLDPFVVALATVTYLLGRPRAGASGLAILVTAVAQLSVMTWAAARTVAMPTSGKRSPTPPSTIAPAPRGHVPAGPARHTELGRKPRAAAAAYSAGAPNEPCAVRQPNRT